MPGANALYNSLKVCVISMSTFSNAEAVHDKVISLRVKVTSVAKQAQSDGSCQILCR